MNPAQAISQAAAPKYGVGETIGNAITQTVDWIGRTVTYVAQVVAEYATKAWEQAIVFFGKSMAFVKHHQETFSFIGAAATVATIAYVLARILGVGAAPAKAHANRA